MQYTLVQYTAYISVHPKKISNAYSQHESHFHIFSQQQISDEFYTAFLQRDPSDFDLFGFNQIGKMLVWAELKRIPFSVMH